MSILTNQGANVFLPPSPVVPPFLNITAITQSFPMVVTTDTPNNYQVNQLAIFNVPASYGMPQVNRLTGQIIATDGTHLSFSIDSTLFDPFVIPLSGEMPATMAPAGSRNYYNTQYVPFHSQGNFGN